MDGNTVLGCLHQYELWMPCQRVEKSLEHPACLASSPFQHRTPNRVGCSQCLHPAAAACDSLFHAPSPADPACSPSTTSTEDFWRCRRCPQRSSTAPRSLCTGCVSCPACGLDGPRGGLSSPPTPLEMSHWLWWEWDHILTQEMQVEAAQWGWFR